MPTRPGEKSYQGILILRAGKEKIAHISLREDGPGIVGLLRFRPETGKPLSEQTEVLLLGESTLSPGERELIAGYVSSQNDCRYCAGVHTAAARHLLARSPGFMGAVLTDHTAAPISDKLKALLAQGGWKDPNTPQAYYQQHRTSQHDLDYDALMEPEEGSENEKGDDDAAYR